MTEPADGSVPVVAGRVEEFPPGAVRLVEGAGHRLAVGNAEGVLFAVDDACLHKGGSLAEGWLDGCLLSCPRHWWRYDVRTGQRHDTPALRIDVHPVSVDVDGQVVVRVTPAEPVRSLAEILRAHAREGAR